MSFKWPMTRLRYLAEFNPPVPSSIRRSSDRLLPLFSMETISDFGLPLAPELRETSSLLTGYAFITQDDVAYAKVTPCFENGKGIVGTELDGPAFATTELTVLRPKPLMNQRFLSYILRSDLFRGPAIASMTGAGGLRRVSETDMKDLPIPTPGLALQNRISDYLDHEAAEIDAFILDQNRLRLLLEEKAVATIQRGVTGSAHNDATNTVPWLPGLPTPYKVVNIRRVADMRTGHTPNRSTPDYWSGERVIPWFTLADVWQLRQNRKYMNETEECITIEGLANSAAELLPAGTVVLSRTASVGFTGVMPSPMATSQDFWNWVPHKELIPEYLWYQFRAMRPEFDRLKSGSTHKTIYQADAAGMRILLPSLEEQQRIVEHLDHADSVSRDASADITRAINLAKERRAALITAAVTGQIDVTHKQRPAVEQLQDDLEEQA